MQMHKKEDAHEANSVADVVNLPVSREEIIYLDTMKGQDIKKALGLDSRLLTVRSYRNMFYNY